MRTERILAHPQTNNQIDRRGFLAATGLLAASLALGELAPEAEVAPGAELPGLARLVEAIAALTDFAANPTREASGAVDIVALLDLEVALVQAVESLNAILHSGDWEEALGRVAGRDPVEMLVEYQQRTAA